MKIHEYQAKEIFASYSIPVPRSRLASTASEAGQATKELGGKAVLKAQVHAGGRGKGGGVKLASTVEDVGRLASDMIGMKLITHQTGPEGALLLVSRSAQARIGVAA